jgi:hypothetical protein
MLMVENDVTTATIVNVHAKPQGCKPRTRWTHDFPQAVIKENILWGFIISCQSSIIPKRAMLQPFSSKIGPKTASRDYVPIFGITDAKY